MSNIIRVAKNKNFSVLSNEPFNEKSLSWKAKGLLAYLLTRPDNWKVQVEHLRKASTDGRDSIYSALKELIQAGYIQRNIKRDDNGRTGGVEYIVSETKLPELPFTEKPETVKPFTEKPDYNKDGDSTNTDSKQLLIGDKPPTKTPEEKLYEEKVAFCKRVIDFVKKNPNKYPKAMYVAFCEYWMEEKENGRKLMRFQKEDFFSMSRRLTTWFKNTKDEHLKTMFEEEQNSKALNVQLANLIKKEN